MHLGTGREPFKPRHCLIVNLIFPDASSALTHSAKVCSWPTYSS